MPEGVDIPVPVPATPAAPAEEKVMDPTLAQFLNTSTLQLQTSLMADHQLAVRRASDTALHGLKVIEAVTAKELLVSDDMGDVLRANMATASPRTVQHYGAPGASESPVGPVTSTTTK